MKALINSFGDLIIYAETETDSYALSKWKTDNEPLYIEAQIAVYVDKSMLPIKTKELEYN